MLRIVTYMGLVLRRVWARRMMLLGSFLGATLVTALLVVLPLYEASVAAVDLLFTFRQAPEASLDLTAVHSSTQYTSEQSESAREAIVDAASPLRTWYPDLEERTLSREFVVIPLADPDDPRTEVNDWLGRAEEWRAQVEDDPELAPPYPIPPREPTQTRFFTSPNLDEYIEIIEGELVNSLGTGSPLLEVVVGEDVARLTGTEVGDQFVLRGFTSQPDAFEVVEVSGIARPLDPTNAVWDQLSPGALTMVPSASFDMWMGSFEIDPEVDPWLRAERGFRRVGSGQTFILHIDRDAVTLENVEDLTRNVVGFSSSVARAEGIRTLTQLPGIVQDFDVRTVVFGAPILAMLALIVAGALYFLIYMAALALERESSELALLRMRGASPWQTTGLHLLQSAIIAVSAVLLAPIVARAMVSLTGRIPPMSTLTGGESLAVASGRSIVPFALAGGAMTFISMGLAILPIARRGVLELRAIATRPARKSVWQRYHLDIFLVVLAGVILFELRQQGIVETSGDELGLDPFSVAAPALFLFSGALLLLRVLPWILRGIGWAMTRIRGLTGALPGWHLGRNPIPYGRLALLVWLTTGFGAFALTYSDTLETSYTDRAQFAAGSDVRIVGDQVGFLDVPEGVSASPVFRGTGAPRLSSRGAELLGVDPATFPGVIAWRSDFGAPAAADLFGPEILGEGPDWGVELPAGTTAIRVSGVVEPEPWAVREESGPRSPVRVMARFVDERHRDRVHAADASFTDEGWSTVSISTSGQDALNGPFADAESMVLQALWPEVDSSTGSGLEVGFLLLDDWVAMGGAGETELTDAIGTEFSSQFGLVVQDVAGSQAAETYYSELPEGEVRPSPSEITSSPLSRSGTVTSWLLSGRNRAQPVPHLRRNPEPMQFVIDGTAASISGLSVGNMTVFGAEGAQIPGSVSGIVDLVPATGDSTLQGVMVGRLDSLLFWMSPDPSWSLTGAIARVTEPQELWIQTNEPNDTIREVLAGYPAEPDEVISAVGVSADFSSRPIQVGLVSILLIGTGAGVVLALAGVTGYVLVAVRRRYREMGVLRALGFRQRGVAGTFALEQLVVLGVGAVVGVVAGLGLMRLMIPFLQLGEEAEELMPPALMQVSVLRLGVYLAVVAGLLVLSVLWSTRSVSARRLSEVLREVER